MPLTTCHQPKSAITPNVSATTIFGTSDDAPYNLNSVSGLTYSQIDFVTGRLRFNTDATIFGLQGLPAGEVVLFGSASNKLFGTNNATGLIDFQTLTGTASNIFTITRGEGIFKGAIGTLTLNESYLLSLDPNIPTTGKSIVNGTIQVFSTTIPEPTPITGLALSMIASALLVRRRYIC